MAGYLAYEAAAAFGLRVREAPDEPPLAWFGVYDPPTSVELDLPPGTGSLPAPRVSLDAAHYAGAVARIQELIARGDTYQVNFTFPLETDLGEDPWRLFQRLVAVQPVPYAAYLDLGRFVLASASPELFFEREGPLLRTRPMKGTAPRGKDLEDDARKAEALRASAKDRAENLMIVDMLRNDLGRVAETGSVRVPALFEVERHPTLLQMTSSVEARSEAPLSRIFEALFPCASVTGAPKVRTMEIIAELEQEPRGVYTGALGWAGSGRACFSVAIRTAVADRERRRVRYSVGSGVVADSRADDEYAECLLKGRILEEEAVRAAGDDGLRSRRGLPAARGASRAPPAQRRLLRGALGLEEASSGRSRSTRGTPVRPGSACWWTSSAGFGWRARPSPRPRAPAGGIGPRSHRPRQPLASPQDDEAAGLRPSPRAPAPTATTCCCGTRVERSPRRRVWNVAVEGREGGLVTPPAGLRAPARGRAGGPARRGKDARGDRARGRPRARPAARALQLRSWVSARATFVG